MVRVPFFSSLFLSVLLVFSQQSIAQSGCTDPYASNYNSGAIVNDGSCVYAPLHYNPVLRATFPGGVISESSGMVWTDGKLWTHNDSGNPKEIYSIDTLTGAILQTVVIDNFPNTDWEDICADNNYIYISNTGNNSGTRTDLKILKIAKADITSGATVHVNAQAINYSYTDQTSFTSSSTHNFDCESLLAFKDSLYIFTKDRGDLKTRVYRMPKVPGTYSLTPYTSFDVNGLLTGADYNNATGEIVLVGYLSGHTNSFMWFLNDFKSDLFFSGNKRRMEIDNGQEWQTEGVCWFANNRFIVSCETTTPCPSAFYIGAKPWLPPVGINTLISTTNSVVYPNPVKDYIVTPSIYTRYRILNVNGSEIIKGIIKDNSIDTANLAAGNYILELTNETGDKSVQKISR